MGQLTQAQLVSTALTLAGNTGLSTAAQTWLKLIVADLYERLDWPWRQSLDTATATPVALAAGAYQHRLGVGGDAFTPYGINDVRRIRAAPASSEIASAIDIPAYTAKTLPNGAAPPGNSTKMGALLYAVLEKVADDQVRVSFYPKANVAYSIWYSVDGGWLDGVYTAGNRLQYPNDRTIVQGLYTYALSHQSDERSLAAEQKFDRMVLSDMVKYGGKMKTNQKWGLSKTRFLKRAPANRTDWMGD